MRSIVPLATAALCWPLLAGPKLTDEQRIELIRGLTAEYATAKSQLPRSKKALEYTSAGEFDKKEWEAAARQYGPAARAGDMVKITRVDIQDDKIVLDINGGFNAGKKKWYQRIEVGGGVGGSSRTTPVSPGSGSSNAPGGTSIALTFGGPTPPLQAAEVKKILAPVLDFEKRSATQTYMESLPPEVQQAVREKRALVGMDRDQVILSLGKPVRKVREMVDGEELEDWIYGAPPGKIVFVTFNGNKVVKVNEQYAGLGTSAAPLPPPR